MQFVEQKNGDKTYLYLGEKKELLDGRPKFTTPDGFVYTRHDRQDPYDPMSPTHVPRPAKRPDTSVRLADEPFFGSYFDPYEEHMYQDKDLHPLEIESVERLFKTNLKDMLTQQSRGTAQVDGGDIAVPTGGGEATVHISKELISPTRRNAPTVPKEAVSDDMYLFRGITRRCMEQTPHISELICHFRGARNTPVAERPSMCVEGHTEVCSSLGLYNPSVWRRESVDAGGNPPKRGHGSQVARGVFRYYDTKTNSGAPQELKDMSNIKKSHIPSYVSDYARVNIVLTPSTPEDAGKFDSLQNLESPSFFLDINFRFYAFFICFYGD
jgi:hypothetical protein